MLSQKLQDDLMSAYQKVYEEKRGHAAGASDTEKQASQLASDVRYKAKSKVPADATEEEKRKIFLQILASSPAPNVVKAMAKEKLLGEEVVHEMRFDDGKEGKEKRKESLRKKRGMTKAQMDKHPQFKDDDVKEGKMPEGLKKFLEKKQGKKEGIKEMVKKVGPFNLKKGTKTQQDLNPTPSQKKDKLDQFKLGQQLDKAHHELSGNPLQEEEKAPRMQKGAMAYDGPNKERSEAADRVLAKTKKKREEKKTMKEMAMSMKDKKPKEKKMSASLLDNIRKVNTGAGSQYEEVIHEKKAKKDYDGDGKVESGTQEFLGSRDKAIKKAIAKKRGRVKEGFSAWRIDLDFQESVKK